MRVNWSDFTVSCRDNGIGFSELDMIGTANALCDLVQVCKELEIVSKHENIVNYKLIKQGKYEIMRLLLGEGTTVTCKGLFYQTRMRRVIDETEHKRWFIRYALVNPHVEISYQSEYFKFDIAKSKSSLHSFENIFGIKAYDIPKNLSFLEQFIAAALGQSSDTKMARDVKMTQHEKAKKVQWSTCVTKPLMITCEPKLYSSRKNYQDYEWINPVTQPKRDIPKQRHSTIVSLSTQQLHRMKLIGQVDKKFIACQSNGLVLVIDQHAADERIRLEKYQSEFNLECVPVYYEYKFNPYYIELNDRHSEKLRHIGVEIKESRFKVSRDYKTTNLNILVKIIQDSLEYYDRVGLDLIPNPVVDHFKSKACRSAVMFGTKLSHEECSKILESLVKCNVTYS
ncbi:DNA mismatch repair protein [Boothiomyces sp. JEL0866]|nr:DNA mismatch repair protein [Boothiomyces sp. JEL0866]